MTVSLVAPERMNLLGLLLRGLLERRLARRPTRLRGEVVLGAGEMRVTVRFIGGGVELTRDPPARRAVASVLGTPAALLDLARGRGLLRAWLRGLLHARGRPLALLRLFLLFRERDT
jgi:hypothetical protein